jgi:cytochrome c oxidase subunit 4
MATEHTHILSFKQLAGVLGILLVLTGVTILASTVDLGPLNVWVALLIASCKSSLVLLYFMHLKYENKVFIGTFLVTIFFVAVMIGFLFWDIAYRTA